MTAETTRFPAWLPVTVAHETDGTEESGLRASRKRRSPSQEPFPGPGEGSPAAQTKQGKGLRGQLCLFLIFPPTVRRPLWGVGAQGQPGGEGQAAARTARGSQADNRGKCCSLTVYSTENNSTYSHSKINLQKNNFVPSLG